MIVTMLIAGQNCNRENKGPVSKIQKQSYISNETAKVHKNDIKQNNRTKTTSNSRAAKN